MSMPADAITSLLTFSPNHLWVMNETSGTTFADSAPGGTALTMGAALTPNWGVLDNAVAWGGPKTPGARFDGSVNGYASIPGKTLGGLAQWSVIAYVQPEVNIGPQTIYSESSGVSTDRLVLWWTAGTMKLTYRDATHGLATIQSGSSGSGGLGAGLYACTSDGTGSIRFYATGSPRGASIPSSFPTAPTAWADSVNTYVGFDPQNLNPAFTGMIGWVATFPAYLTDQQLFAISQAVSPNEPNTYLWTRSVSGTPFPATQLWNDKLPDNTTLDPNSAAKIQNWATVNSTIARTALGGGGEVLMDVNRVGVYSPLGIKDAFYSTPDQVAFLSQCTVPTTCSVELAQPAGGSNDAIGAGVELDRGRQWDVYLGTQVGPSNQTNRHPQWNPSVNSTTTTVGVGSLASGWYDYAVTVVTASGKEGGLFGYNGIVTVNLTGTGSITLNPVLDKVWSDPPDHWRIYRRGPYTTSTGGSNADYGLLATVAAASWSSYPTVNQFVDDGTHGTPDVSQKPMFTITGSSFSLTVSGTNNAGQNVLTLRSNPNSFNFPTYGIPTWNATPLGPVTLGTGGTQESVFIKSVISDTQVRLASNLAFTHSDGEPFGPISNAYGAVAKAVGPEMTSRGGGGSWDWYNNAAFNPAYSPSANTNNGQSASSRPSLGGVITIEEALNGVIPHRMAFAMYASINSINSHRWPAQRNDGSTITVATNFWREGIVIRLPAGFDETTVSYTTRSAYATAFQKAFTVAMRDYGSILSDSSPGGLFYIENASAAVGRNDGGWVYSGLSSGSRSVSSILDFMFAPGPTITASTTIGSPTITGISSFTGLTVGAYIISANLPYLTRIQSLNPGAGTALLTQPAASTTTLSCFAGLIYQLQVIQSYRFATKTDVLGTFTADTTAGLVGLANVSDYTSVYPGLIVTGAGIQHATTIATIDPLTNTATLSQPATQSHAALSLTTGRRTNNTSVGTVNTPGFQQLVPY